LSGAAMRSHVALGANGPLAGHVRGFVPRPGQQAMARAVESALDEHRTLIVESGTGTGKTFAYLVPSLLSGLRVVISSGTRNLQDQLFRRDLPTVREALAVATHAALLKGRSNYLCLYRMERSAEEGRFASRATATRFQKIQSWARSTRQGDVAELGDVAEESELWPLVTSTVDNCLGSECPRYAECFVVRARREAAEAEIVVVNHHLFFADMSVREEGFAQLLPAADAVIFDEAHQLPDIAANAFGVALSSHQLRNLCRDAVAEDVRERSGLRELRPTAEAAERATADMRLALGSLARTPWSELAARTEVGVAYEALRKQVRALAEVLDAAAARGGGLANCARRAVDIEQRLADIAGGDDLDRVSWVETSERGFVLRLTPLDVARTFRERVHALGTKSWVYTSATLAVGEDFGYFARRLGLEDAQTAHWTSPFDYAQCALLYVPPSLPDPGAADYTARMIEAALPVLRASGGRAFMLFTSHRALRVAAEVLKQRIEYPLLVQGSMGRMHLLESFVKAGNAVLLGTGSFWEGVDVPGPALSCVIIDKLPFAAPDDPVLKARAIACTAAGRNPFVEYQLPEAVISLKQGAGRLIRSFDDSGVLMLCDPRLYTRRYGRLFLESLPPMPISRDIADVREFFAGRIALDNPV
jgi:ATP-dependent DNA helicase DinG